MAVLACDLGGVIRDRLDYEVRDPKVLIPGAVQALRKLVSAVGRKDALIISRCDAEHRESAVDWLRHQNFIDFTGFDPENIHFCETAEEKVEIAEACRVTHFVDNRVRVFEVMGL